MELVKISMSAELLFQHMFPSWMLLLNMLLSRHVQAEEDCPAPKDEICTTVPAVEFFSQTSSYMYGILDIGKGFVPFAPSFIAIMPIFVENGGGGMH